MVSSSTYDAIKKADIIGFRKEFFIPSLEYLARFKQNEQDKKFEAELIYIHEELMRTNAYT